MSNLPHSPKQLSNEKISYSKHSIIFEDNFDILFNRGSVPNADRVISRDSSWEKKSKLEQQAMSLS